jgi:death-on-curing protein
LHYLTLEDVAEINARFVGPDGLADIGLLESAVLRPQSSAFGQDAYGTVHQKAGALFHSLVRNHPFVDGNKRTAVVAVFTFYALNGLHLAAEDGDMVALAVDTAEGQIDAQTIAKRLESWVEPANLPELGQEAESREPELTEALRVRLIRILRPT